VIVSFKQNCGYFHEKKHTGNFEKNISVLLKFSMNSMLDYGALVENNAHDPKIGGSNPNSITHFYPCIQTILEENTH
jgi:hypothetical protein